MFGTSKPYTAVTVQIERLTSEQYEENDLSGIVDLVDVIRVQASGPAEAARALRKKLKYGDVHRQLRALTILDGLIQNAGPRFQRAFVDEPLLERLRVVATDPVSDPAVTAKCKILFGQWAVTYKDTPDMSRMASLYKQLPQRKKVRGPTTADSKVLKESSEPAEGDSRRPSLVETTIWASASGSSPTESGSRTGKSPSKPTKDKFHRSTGGGRTFNLEKEKPQLLQTLASTSMASTNLLNLLKRINRENHRVSADREVMTQVESCKHLRRQVLRYIQHVESEQWLGSLIHANEELVNALMAFEVLDKSVEDDSDSEEDGWNESGDREDEDVKGADKGRRKSRSDGPPTTSFAGLMLAADDRPARPPRPPGGSKPVMTKSVGIGGSGAGRTGAGSTGGKGKQKAPTTTQKEDGFDDDWDNDDGRQEEEDEEVVNENEDENDPFADRNAIRTPSEEREDVIWA
ncbi:MAG: putative actin patch assembly and actin polymerization protein [Watsoniomyces obsoletus]|nr:MAG: putative actin patch assembly and actin polymerization protein [Watsoniomyces obsoletus]